jgi:hypothetical protein
MIACIATGPDVLRAVEVLHGAAGCQEREEQIAPAACHRSHHSSFNTYVL